jgi:hypothetical protein
MIDSASPTSLPELLSLQTVYHIMLGSAVVTTIINVTWFAISKLQQTITRLLRRRIVHHHVVLGTLSPAEFQTIMEPVQGFFCLIVRYGRDDYLERLGSDEDRDEGRLLLKTIPLDLRQDQDGNTHFTLRLPIHKRLGTQFKCFAVLRKPEETQKVIAQLKKCENIADAEQADSRFKNRIYLLLAQFAEVTTVDNIRNNFIYPE